MTVKQLKEELEKYDDDVDVMTKKTEIMGNIGEINSVRKDSYGFLWLDVPCVLLTDEYVEESEV